MTVGNGTGYLAGQVVLRIPLLEDDVAWIPFKGVTVTLIAGDGQHTSVTDADGYFRFDDLVSGQYRVCVDQELTRDDDTLFQLLSDEPCQWIDLPAGSSIEVELNTFEYAITSTSGMDTLLLQRLAGIEAAAKDASSSLSDIEDTAGTLSDDVNTLTQTTAGAVTNVENHKDLIITTARSISGIESALRDMTTYPFSGPADSDGTTRPASRSRQSGREATNGVRSSVESALASLGVSGDLTPEDLERMFPAETNGDGAVTYRWAGPVVPTRSAARMNGQKPGTVQVSGALSRFQQRAMAALTEIKDVLATLQPISGHDVDPQALATQKRIIIQTMQSIVDEPSRPDGARTLAVDLQFNSLLDDKILVERNKPQVDGNLGVLEYMLGIDDVVISDQDTETQMTEWHRVYDAVLTARASWEAYKNAANMPELRFGERLQELHGLFGALSESAEDSRSMLRTVRYTPQEQASQKFPTATSGDITIDDLLSMVDDLAHDIGPTYIIDWKGRGIATLGGRATRLADTVDDIISSGEFPFTSTRVQTAFEDIARLLRSTAAVCDEISGNQQQQPGFAQTFSVGSTP